MKTILSIVAIFLLACQTQKAESELFFNVKIDGQSFEFNEDEVLTSYKFFAPDQREFRIYATKEDGLSLTLTIINDMKTPSSTPSGSKEPTNQLFQGSVSLQDFPEKGYTFNNYDGFINPKPEPEADAILITASQMEPGGKAQMIKGKINTVVLGGENKDGDKRIKDRQIWGEFCVRHKFNGVQL